MEINNSYFSKDNYIDLENKDLRKEFSFLNNSSYVRFFSQSNGHVNPVVCAWEKTNPNKYPIGPWKLTNYVVHFIFSGCGVCEYQNKKIVVEPGSIFAITPGIEVAYRQNHNNPWRSVWFEIIGSDCGYLFKDSGIGEGIMVRKMKNYQKFCMLFLNLMEDSKRLEDQNGYIFLSNIYKIFDAIAEEIIETKNKIIYKNKILNDIISYIDNNFGNKITTKTIADEFYISPQYLARIFKKEVEMTPSEYLTSVRLSKAANMLTNTNFSITTISELVGFSNPFYFTNSFRAKYLIPPRRYRDLQILQKKKELN